MHIAGIYCGIEKLFAFHDFRIENFSRFSEQE